MTSRSVFSNKKIIFFAFYAKSFIKTLDISDIDNLWQHFDSNYDILSPFTQLNRLDHDNKVVSFNSFMHNFIFILRIFVNYWQSYFFCITTIIINNNSYCCK